jgi:nucleotide-binding universal stress UspA family protein
MTQTDPLQGVKVESIFHPSDFSSASEVAFAHALKIALVTKARLTMLHVSADAKVDWHDFPGVRDTLERWGVIPQGSPRSAVGKLGLEIGKVVAESKDPVQASLRFLEKHPADLIVLAVHQDSGRMGWLGKSVGKPIAQKSGQITLLIPHGVEGFVSRADGSVSLKNVLVPVAAKPRPQPAIEAASRIIRNLGMPAGTVSLLHVGEESEMPAVQTPEVAGWKWTRLARKGDPAEAILQAAAELKADLVLMTTDGPEGFLDGLRGTTSERVLRKIQCPVANLPAGSLLG